jgi:hypothetical protein
VAQTIPALPNTITTLLHKGNRMNSLTSKECVFNFINPIYQLNLIVYLMKC